MTTPNENDQQPAPAPGSLAIDMAEPDLADQPLPEGTPENPLKAIEGTPEGDALIVIKHDNDQILMHTMVDQSVPNWQNNPAVAYMVWLTRNHTFLCDLFLREFRATQALEQAQRRQRIQLVDAQGHRIEPL